MLHKLFTCLVEPAWPTTSPWNAATIPRWLFLGILFCSSMQLRVASQTLFLCKLNRPVFLCRFLLIIHRLTWIAMCLFSLLTSIAVFSWKDLWNWQKNKTGYAVLFPSVCFNVFVDSSNYFFVLSYRLPYMHQYCYFSQFCTFSLFLPMFCSYVVHHTSYCNPVPFFSGWCLLFSLLWYFSDHESQA